MAARRTGGSESGSVAAALGSNHALVRELRDVVSTLTEEETRLRLQMQAIRHRMAMRRAQQAMNAIAPAAARQARPHADTEIFAREPENVYKPVFELPRSYIRPRRSFFHDDDDPREVSIARKRGRKPKGYHEHVLQQKQAYRGSTVEDPSEPAPNADTLLLRQHSHEAFLAVPAKVFTAKEREIVKTFGEAQLKLMGKSSDPNHIPEIPLSTWNLIAKRNKPPIHRTGFACKLRWELYDKPGLRLCAWTKVEDTALKALASGEVDPSIVNKWDVISDRMPIPGRPPVHCLIRYQTKLCASNLNTTFTPEEDALIHEAIGVFGERWNIIADLMDGRVSEQIRHRWQLSLSPNVKHGKFSIMEDRRMLLALYAYHDKSTPFQKESISWTDVCHHVPGRLQPPLRERFLNSLNSEISFTSWTKQDDEKLLRVVKRIGLNHPGVWVLVAAEMGNRSDSQVARRWKFLAPEEYKKYQEEKKNAVTLPAIFQRPILGRKRTRSAGYHAKRNSYNATTEESEQPSTSEQQSTPDDDDESTGNGGGRNDAVYDILL
jgi:myb proto-oncogene protein|uniref:Uncharacterized protein n=1 Tax=Globisporangium ultimum (strain ATCC 200006 / CBS 805.95 / DAOM BR144) TaxID=431595 RepID=K3WBI1_GLOUD